MKRTPQPTLIVKHRLIRLDLLDITLCLPLSIVIHLYVLKWIKAVSLYHLSDLILVHFFASDAFYKLIVGDGHLRLNLELL